SVIAIETPVRRKLGESFGAAEMKRVVALANREDIKLHLDGARLFLQAAYTGENIAETARMFDTVYVSLYKYFNAASGAILAGPRRLLDGMYHDRRMFGGGLNMVWPFALVALHYLQGFSDRYRTAVQTAEDLIRGLSAHDNFTVERVPSGTNIFRLRVRDVDAPAFQKRLAARGVMLAAPNQNAFIVGVNETLNRMKASDLVDAFVRAIA
ncbi:MAG TPA: beta-eliminating lyase-related protein, partial [Vicinamibacterales bacterium]